MKIHIYTVIGVLATLLGITFGYTSRYVSEGIVIALLIACIQVVLIGIHYFL